MAKETKQDLILHMLEDLHTKHDKLDSKVDKIAEEKLPSILVDVARLNEKTSRDSKLYTLIGGGIAVLISVGSAVAMAIWK